MYGLRVVLADADPDYRKHLKEKLLNAGHIIVGESSQCRKALATIFKVQPDLVIINVARNMKDNLTVAQTVGEHRIAPVIIVTEPEKVEELEDVLEDWAISYITKPVDETNLLPAIEVSYRMFRGMCHLEEENRKLKTTLETRKLVEKAKGLLIDYNGMTEPEAFKHLQKTSMDKCIPIRSVALQIIKSLCENK